MAIKKVVALLLCCQEGEPLEKHVPVSQLKKELNALYLTRDIRFTPKMDAAWMIAARLNELADDVGGIHNVFLIGYTKISLEIFQKAAATPELGGVICLSPELDARAQACLALSSVPSLIVLNPLLDSIASADLERRLRECFVLPRIQWVNHDPPLQAYRDILCDWLNPYQVRAVMRVSGAEKIKASANLARLAHRLKDLNSLSL